MHLLPTNYQKSQFCHSILTVWIAHQSTSWNYLKSTWITWRPSILNFRCRNSISIWLWSLSIQHLHIGHTPIEKWEILVCDLSNYLRVSSSDWHIARGSVFAACDKLRWTFPLFTFTFLWYVQRWPSWGSRIVSNVTECFCVSFCFAPYSTLVLFILQHVNCCFSSFLI